MSKLNADVNHKINKIRSKLTDCFPFQFICSGSDATSGYMMVTRPAAVVRSLVDGSSVAPLATPPELIGVISAMARCSGSAASMGCLFYILLHRETGSYCLPCYWAV